MIEKFEASFKPSGNFEPVTEDVIAQYSGKVPELMINLWKKYGFGNFNNGLIEFINPKDFEDSLATWLGRKVDNYTPFAITGFGELLYYRKLTETDEDVCMIDIQFRKIESLIWSFNLFIEELLTDEDQREHWFRQALFEQAVKEQGELSRHEIFTITPALALGGGLEPANLKKGNAQVYQDIIFQMTAG